MKFILLLGILFSSSLWASPDLMKVANCKGQMMDGGVMVDAQFLVYVDQNFSPEKHKKYHAAIMDEKGMGIWQAELTSKKDKYFLQTKLRLPKPFKRKPVMKLDIEKSDTDTASAIVRMIDEDLTNYNSFEFSCVVNVNGY